MTTSRRPPTLLVFADDWGRHPSSCQHLVRHLLDRHEVYWVNTIGMRAPRLDRATLARGLEKVRHWTSRASNDEQSLLPANLHVLSPWMWPWFRSGFDRRINRALLLGQLVPVLESMPAPPIAITTVPIVSDLVGRLPVERWVYYCVDDFGHWPGLDQTALRRLEESLVRRVETLITVSETLQDKLSRMGRASHLLSHGVELDHWSAPGRGPKAPLPELVGLPRPLVVFWGMLDRRIDVRFLVRLASDLTEGTIVLVGPESDPDPALAAIPRLVRLPPFSYERLPDLAREASVLIMPYADLAVTRAMQPLKLKEYLATGKPAVARALPATRGWADCLDLAATPEAFSESVRLRIATGLTAAQEAARDRLAEEGWDEKARAFEVWMTSRRNAPERQPPLVRG
jgi:glycosyltransferase involved in cell wall biosynthesis